MSRFMAVPTKDKLSGDAYWYQIRDTQREQNLLGYYHESSAKSVAAKLNGHYAYCNTDDAHLECDPVDAINETLLMFEE